MFRIEGFTKRFQAVMRLDLRRGAGWAIAASLLATLILATAASATVEFIVTFSGDDGWVFRNASCTPQGAVPGTGMHAFETGPDDPPAGNGSLELRTGDNGTTLAEMRQNAYNGLPLSELTDGSVTEGPSAGAAVLSYWTRSDGNNTGDQINPNTMPQQQQIHIALDIDWDGVFTTAEDTIIYEPVYQQTGGATNDSTASDQAPLLNTWQTWDAENGEWWSNALDESGGRGSQADPITISQYLAQPDVPDNARLAAAALGSLRLRAGCNDTPTGGWRNFIGNTDALNIKFTSQSDVSLHNFENAATAAPETTSTPTAPVTQSPVTQGPPTSLESSPGGGTGSPGGSTPIGGQTSNPPSPPPSSPGQSPTTGQSPTSGQSPTASATATATATSVPTATQTTTPGATASASPTPGATQTASPSPSPSPSPTFPDTLSFDTDLSIRYRNSSFRGRASSPLGSCERDRAVVVRKVRPGRDRVVGRDRTDSTGGWRISKPNADGRFYAVARATQFTASDGTRIACLRARSRTISA